MPQALDHAFLNEIFPPQRTEEFFEALFGGAEEGAYDIRLTCDEVTDDRAILSFDLHERPGKCLVCNLTYGLPQVFRRHPVLDVAGVARAVAERLGWDPAAIQWELGHTQEGDPHLHRIPFILARQK